MGELDYMDKINMDENLQIDEGLCGHVNELDGMDEINA
jgi:hypothetical protein